MSETNHDEPKHNKEVVPSAETIELLASMEEDALSVMKDTEGQPKKVHALQENITVGIDPTIHQLASSARVTHIDATTHRAWILYRIPGRSRPAYGWVSLAKIIPALTFTIKNDIPDTNDDDTVDLIMTGAHAAAVNLVDGKIQVTPYNHVIPVDNPKYPYIKGTRRLEKTVTGVLIYSRSADHFVSATVSVVDSELKYFLAEYVVDGRNMHKWLTGDDFTPELVIKQE